MPKKKMIANQPPKQQGKDFHIELLNGAQKLAWAAFQQHDVLFLIGPAGSGKTFLSCAFAVKEILAKQKSKIILTRPVVEAGESLGFLPGSLEEKINPYMMPMYDCLDKLTGKTGTPLREKITNCIEVAPLAYLRGRAQPLDSIVMTPNGPVKMGEIQVGDLVFGVNGQAVKVLGTFPQGKKQVVEVIFNDGSRTQCCCDHLWNTETLSEKRHGKGFSTKTTKEISNHIKTKFGQKNHRIPLLQSPVNFVKKEVPINPYLLGLLLGDGCFHNQAGISYSTIDAELLESARELCPENTKIVRKANNIDYIFRQIEKKRYCSFKKIISDLGLMGSKSYNKFIPDIYKFNSTEDRLALLQGLMDTDGSVYLDRKSYRSEFSSTSECLARDVIFLVQSLGGIAFMYEKKYNDDGHMLHGHIVKHQRSSFKVMITLPNNLCPFRLSRKSDKWNCGDYRPIKLIAEIKEIGEKECQCIQVDAKDGLYLTDNFIVTHNTFDDSVCLLDEAQNCSMQQLKLFLTRFGKDSKIIITGDPNQSDLRGPVALVQAVRKLRNVNGIGVIEFKNNSIVRHPLVGSILDALAEEGEVDHRSYDPVFPDDNKDDDVPTYFSKHSRNVD